MNVERWNALKALFEEALALQDEERRAFLSELKQRDPGLHEDLISLLTADAETAHVVDGDPASLLGAGEARPADAEDTDARIGSRFGVWQITGRGLSYSRQLSVGATPVVDRTVQNN